MSPLQRRLKPAATRRAGRGIPVSLLPADSRLARRSTRLPAFFLAPAVAQTYNLRKRRSRATQSVGGGEFRPRTIWDENVEWLKKFAGDHPEYDIPLPEDVE